MLHKIFVFLFLSLSVLSQSFDEEIAEHREKYIQEFLKSDKSPLNAEGVKYLDFYEPDESFRVNAKVKKIKGGKLLEFPTSSGKLKTYREYAILKFKLGGKRHLLTVYQSMANLRHPIYKNYLFLPFKDATAAKETYGAGRYIDLQIKDLNKKRTILDFNKAYNPYCAYSDGYSCPVPPANNTLDISINAGEKNFKKGH